MPRVSTCALTLPSTPVPSDMIMDSMVASKQLDESLREQVREAVLKKHHHQNEKKLSNRIPLVRSLADMGKKHSDPHLLDKNGEKGLTFRPGSSTTKDLGKVDNEQDNGSSSQPGHCSVPFDVTNLPTVLRT